jgi:hypothetical protein
MMQLVRYTAKLRGAKSREFHLNNLKSNSTFVCRKKTDQESVFEVIGPIKHDDYLSLNEINIDLSSRAEIIGIQDTDLAENTSRQIFNAQEAEKIVLAGKMLLTVLPSKEGFLLSVTLTVSLDNNSMINECINQYSSLRFIWLANAMGMAIEGDIERIELV